LKGTLIAGRYRLERVLGEGGMGVVYEAVQEGLGRRVALKLLSDIVTPAGLARLRNEAEVMARLGNPHVVQVTDFHAAPGEQPCLVMELLAGQSLRQLLQAEGVLAWDRAARIGVQILDALAAAHAARIVHRDIKPENVFMVASAAIPDMVKVLDFGIAKLLEAPDAAPMTRPGALIGTVAYMSPEQACGGSVDPRADLYAVGVCLYEAVAGRRPIEASELRSLIRAIGAGDTVPLERHCPQLPPAFAAAVMRALRLPPEERFQSAGEMAAALMQCVGVAPSVSPHTVMSGSAVLTHAAQRGQAAQGAASVFATGTAARRVSQAAPQPSPGSFAGGLVPSTLASPGQVVAASPAGREGATPYAPATAPFAAPARLSVASQRPPQGWNTPPHGAFDVAPPAFANPAYATGPAAFGPGASAHPAPPFSPVAPTQAPPKGGTGALVAVLVVLLVLAVGVAAGALFVRVGAPLPAAKAASPAPAGPALASPAAGPMTMATVTQAGIVERLKKAGWSITFEMSPNLNTPGVTFTTILATKDLKNIQVAFYDYVDPSFAAGTAKELAKGKDAYLVKREGGRVIAIYGVEPVLLRATLDAIVK
jgi:serine/threonine-protein kinase